MSVKKNYYKLHFIGAGGISLSALAKLMLKWGKTVSGSDTNFSKNVIELMEKGADIWIGSNPQSIKNPDLAVYSSAISKDDKELVHCRNIGVPVMERHIFLGEVAKEFSTVVAIGGTHGKTTCTGMLGHILKHAAKGFCAHIGGEVVDMGNLYYSGDDFFITEACEYKKSLLSIPSNISVVLNAENDHPDTFYDLEDVYCTFDIFLSGDKNRLGLVCGDTDYYKKHLKQKYPLVLTFRTDKAFDFYISDIHEHKDEMFGFTLNYLQSPLVDVNLSLVGFHNVYNAAAAMAVSYLLKIDNEIIKSAVENFQGIKRRFEKRGSLKGADIYHDYAHHPSEISAVMQSAKRLTKSRLIIVFQPHTFSRTALLFDDFIEVLAKSDLLYLLKEYPARENFAQGKSAEDLYHKLKNKCQTKYFDKTLPLAKDIIENIEPFDTVLVLGAGDVDKLCDILLPQENN